MFKCQKCQQSTHRPSRVPVERRVVQHTDTGEGPRGGRGTQIVREVTVCESCLLSTPEAPIERFEAVQAVKTEEML